MTLKGGPGILGRFTDESLIRGNRAAARSPGLGPVAVRARMWDVSTYARSHPTSLASSIFIKNKHLASSGIRGGKFAADDIAEAPELAAQGLRSDGVQFLPNQVDDTFRAIVPVSWVVRTRGETKIRVIVTNDGRVINAFSVNAR
ncbi:hypothetical protein [Prauserella alba]|uniref:Uncharacterized protein n=1 Tax=Prauserella alba TaxID=176898 RepID=A0ABP4FPF2_9PSEU|nr:hypothetical protein [Prauserella alba]MCP2180060.1 hypothetical protein [Prauserella alba]